MTPRAMPSWRLFALIMSYAMMLVMANWFDPRLVSLFGLNTDAGTLAFPVSFLLADIITEVYGYKFARLAIWIGFFWNMIFLAYGSLIVHLPNPPYIQGQQPFDQMFSSDVRIILASILSYFCAEPLNAFLLAKLKVFCNGRKIALRFVVSTLCASAVDSSIFTWVAFYGVIPTPKLWVFALTMWGIKVSVEVVGLFVSIPLALKLKRWERLDRFDRNTRFNLFSVDVRY